MAKGRLELSKRPGDVLLASFFVIHLPVMILLDGQTLFPKHWFPAGARELVQWHLNTNGDYLLRDVPPFFRALVVCEMFLQIPFHIALAYAFLAGSSREASSREYRYAKLCTVHNLECKQATRQALKVRLSANSWTFTSNVSTLGGLSAYVSVQENSGDDWQVPILGDIMASQVPTRNTLLAIYVPYLVIPLLVIARVIPHTDPFAAPTQNVVDKKMT